MPGEIVTTKKDDSGKENVFPQKVVQNDINVDKILGRTCYFSLSGDLAFKEFEKNFSTFSDASKRRKVKEAFRQRLYFAVLMFDHVVMHCSDPLRTEIVLEVLEENVQWVENGNIMFIFPNGINDIQRDYSQYIQRKIGEYEEGYFCEKEAASLNQKHMNEPYYLRVKNLLSKSPWLVRKSKNKDFFFDKLVLGDLDSSLHQEQVLVDSKLDLPQILSLSLSLYQLLNIIKYDGGESSYKCEHVFPIRTIKRVCRNIKEHLNQKNTIARTAIVDSLLVELDKQELTEIQEAVIRAISLRMDVLYCHMNSGTQMILEFHPSYEHRSMYQLEYFLDFLKIIAQSDKKIKLNVDIINRMLLDPNLQVFRLCYLSSMADTYEHKNLAKYSFEQRANNDLKIFNEISKNHIETFCSDSFESIKKALNGDIV